MSGDLYLILPSLQAARARSNQQALALGCDGILTIYWWEVIPLPSGEAAIVIEPNSPFDATTTDYHGNIVGLDAFERAALVTWLNPQTAALPVFLAAAILFVNAGNLRTT